MFTALQLSLEAVENPIIIVGPLDCKFATVNLIAVLFYSIFSCHALLLFLLCLAELGYSPLFSVQSFWQIC